MHRYFSLRTENFAFWRCTSSCTYLKNVKTTSFLFFDFNQSCGMQLDPNNQWIQLANRIPWEKMEGRYAALFPSRTGHPATTLRMALGIWIIQTRKGLSDRKTLAEIQENPYLQYFIGMEAFSHKAPVVPSMMVEFRKRLTADYLMEINECILARSEATRERQL